MDGLSAVVHQLQDLDHKIHTGHANAAIEPLKKILNEYKHEPDIHAHALYLMAWVQWAKNQYSEAAKTIRSALKKMHRDYPAYFPALLKKASIETSQNLFFKGLNTWLFILDHADSNQHQNIISEAYLGIGSYFKIKETTELAETCFQYAYDYSKQGKNREAQVKCGIYLISAYCSTNKYIEAKDTIDECWQILKSLHDADPVLYADMYHYNGITFAAQGLFEEAIESIHQAQKINEEKQFLWGQTQNRIQLAKILAQQSQYNAAITQLESAILISSIFDHGVIQQEICGIIREIHKENHNFAAALSAHEAFHHLAIKNRQYFTDDGKKKNTTRLKTLENRLDVIKKKQTEVKLKATIHQLEQKIIELTSPATVDPLTSAPNQLYLFENQSTLIRPEHQSVTHLLVSINNLFDINNLYGSAAGNDAICTTYQALMQFFNQKASLIIRYSGQNFLALNVNSEALTELDQIGVLLEKLANKNQHKIELDVYQVSIQKLIDQDPQLLKQALLWHYPAGDKQ